ncbi:MAG: phosphoenolpyruvate carboxykinase (GTP) [Oscillospiraceae bacterium]|nr:phosphoenolpyruvate carboxykinase (GTP) [Oscillospiraceae bacterium]
MIKNKSVLDWVDKCKILLNAKEIVWVDGTEKQTKKFYKDACESNQLIKLNEKLLPNCFLHRSNPNDVARVEDRTFICCGKKENSGFTNNWWEPKNALEKLNKIAKNSYTNRVMYVIPFSMANPNSEFAKFGVEITDSIYVVLSMLIMTRVNSEVYEIFANKNDDWSRCLHCSCDGNEKERYICHFPEKNTVFSVNSSYGGNALLGKKCLALRLASYMGKQEGWLAEHMLILGIKIPEINEIKYICAAFPSGCGKTNLAMLKPGSFFEKKGYKIFCVGDDIAWLRVGSDGRLWAINPENGFFGIGVGTSEKTNPNALKTAQKDTIFTNVAYDCDNRTVWWEGLNESSPKNVLNWKGENPKPNEPLAHQNSRFAAPAKNCPCLSPEFNNPKGVPISAIIFGGRRAKLTPLVLQSKDWNHGVFLGSIMSSETTHAADGKTGVLRHDPFGMLPFCGYNISNYFDHWLEIGEKLDEKAPKIFNVNWFRIDENGKFIWPGFAENLRVITWIIKRCENQISAKETNFGFLPNITDFNTENLSIDKEKFQKILEIDPVLWKKEMEEISNFYNKLGLKNKFANEISKILENQVAGIN